MTRDDPNADRLAAQAALYDQALDCEVTDHAVDFLCRSHMLQRISDDIDTIKPFLHTDAGRAAARREYDQLSDDERTELLKVMAEHYSLNLNLAVRKVWHAANVLGFNGTTLDPKHVAMVAVMFLSRTPEEVYDELAEVAK